MAKNIIAISNHAFMLGGGEHSFLDLLPSLPDNWRPIAVVPQKGDLEIELRKKGMEVRVILLPAVRPWFTHKILANLKTFLKLLREIKPALIYANGSRAALYSGLIGRILGIPVVWHCRIAQQDPRLDFILTRLSNLIIANSKATAKRFNNKFQSKVKVVYNGLDIKWLQNKNVKKPDKIYDEWKIILVVARISRWKRHDLVLSAFEEVAKTNTKVHLVCIGAKDQIEPHWWDYLKERTHHSQFSSRIHWIGHVDDVRPWYRAASMLVLASENEPFGRVLVEAMACGVPVIATRNGGVPEIVRHNEDGLLVCPGKGFELAQAMNRILKDNVLRNRLVRSAPKRSVNFSLEAHVKKMSKLFEDTINKP